jgi:ethanolamine ammonia-lyase small subunit
MSQIKIYATTTWSKRSIVLEDQKVSNPTSNIVDKDTLDTLAVTRNIGDVTDTIENIENSEIHSGKNYDWGKR